MTQVRASTVQQETEEVFAALQCAASGRIVKSSNTEKGEAKEHRTERCAAACMRCGRSSKYLKMQGKCEGPEWLCEDFKHKLGRWGNPRLGGLERRRGTLALLIQLNRSQRCLHWIYLECGNNSVSELYIKRFKEKKETERKSGRTIHISMC